MLTRGCAACERDTQHQPQTPLMDRRLANPQSAIVNHNPRQFSAIALVSVLSAWAAPAISRTRRRARAWLPPHGVANGPITKVLN